MNPLVWLEQRTQQAVISVKNLAGLTACSYLVTLETGSQYVLRTQTARATALGIDYQQEALVLDTLAPLGFAPNVVYASAQGAILEWQAGSVPSAFSEPLLSQLAQRLASLHRFGTQAGQFLPNIAKLDLTQRCQFLWRSIPLAQREQVAEPNLPDVEPFAQTLCHHDVHLGNLIETDSGLMLIDWEYAAISDPALDIALFLHGNALSESQRAQFLADYFRYTPFDVAHFEQKMAEYRPAIECLNRLWFLI